MHARLTSGAFTALIPSDTPPPAAYVHPFSRRERLLTVSVFTLMASLIFADQNLLAPNLSTAAAFFGFNDVQKDQLLGGYISAAFFAVGAPSAMLVGWYADRMSRRNLLFAVAMIGQVPSLLTIFVTQFWQFFVIRIFTGVSVGGCFPLLYSLLGDFFPPGESLISNNLENFL
jgi:MFS family permease